MRVDSMKKSQDLHSKIRKLSVKVADKFAEANKLRVKSDRMLEEANRMSVDAKNMDARLSKMWKRWTRMIDQKEKK